MQNAFGASDAKKEAAQLEPNTDALSYPLEY
jgi:hypothetical protein